MCGNFVIGIIVFAILVIVNFVVITKGSGRIAEVAARFHLDAMPGKQMAIDADLSAGLIDEKTAKERRKALEDESGFFGAMDGASKFVRGDAVALAWSAHKKKRANTAAEAIAAAAPETAAAAAAAAAEEPIANALKIDDLKIELGYALLPLVNGPDGTDRLTEQIKALRRSLAVEMGFVMPAVRILDNVQLEANTYVIKIKEVDAGTGKIWPNQFMGMDPSGNQDALPGIHTIQPTFGVPATWVEDGLEEGASLEGYTVVDAATVLSTHLTELLKNNMSDF